MNGVKTEARSKPFSRAAILYIMLGLLVACITALFIINSSERNGIARTLRPSVSQQAKSFAAAYTVTRTYTSRSTIVINNLWKNTYKLVGGLGHACALSNGKVYCWGDNTYGQLGDGTNTSRTNPVQVGGSLNNLSVTDISAGGSHSCAIANGRAYCWGNNGTGRLGNGNTTNQSSPVAVSTTSGAMLTRTVTAIASGGYHTCAIADNRAYCWGRGNEGQLGNSSPANANNDTAYSSSVPVAVGGGSTAVSYITAGSNHSCAITGGLGYCWGGTAKPPSSNPCHGGRIGDNSDCNGNKNAPVAVNAAGVLSGRILTQIVAGGSHTCAIADGRAYCWGYNNQGQVGDGTTISRLVPVAVSTSGSSQLPSTATVTSIATGIFSNDGEYETCAVAEGKGYCWGYNNYGQLGTGTSVASSSVPLAVSSSGVLSGKYMTEIVSGSPFACGIANGRAYCWGKNNFGQLGNGTTTNVNVPYRVNDSYYN